MLDLSSCTKASEWWVYGYNEYNSGRYNRVCGESYSVRDFLETRSGYGSILCSISVWVYSSIEAAQTKPAMMSRYRNKGESAKRMMRRCRRFSKSHKTL